MKTLTKRSFAQRIKAVFAALSLMVAINVAYPTLAGAQELSESHIAIARKAISNLQATNTFDRILPISAERIKQNLIKLRPDLSDQIIAIVDEEAIKIAPRRGDLEQEAAKVYARVFSEKELSEIDAFFSSEAGKKLLNESPVVNRELDKASRVWAEGINRDLNAAVDATIKERGLQ